ncbi:MAG: hypothetical protein H5T59_08785 [Anaerolineae bacterium]|nr:hypothetical protein [Anaerolineae bacterium]
MEDQVRQCKPQLGVPKFLFAAFFVALGLGLVLVLSSTQTAWATPEQSVLGQGTLPCVEGSVTLQGRPAPPHPSWAVPVTMNLYEPGTNNLEASYPANTDQSGNFKVCDLITGTHDITLKNPHTLRNRLQNVTLNPLITYTLSFGTLLEGDANDNNRVEIFDFSILATAYRSVPGDPNWDPRADFNENDRIEIFDFSLLATNYGREGDIILSALEAGEAITTPVDLGIWPPVYIAEVGEVFALLVQAYAGEQPVDGVSLYLDFDPALLQVVDAAGNPVDQIEAQPLLPNVLYNQADNALGQIEFHAGRELGGTPPTGTFPVALIRFKALAPTGGTPVAFSQTLPRQTDVAFEGYSVLGNLYDGQVRTAGHKIFLFPVWRNVEF